MSNFFDEEKLFSEYDKMRKNEQNYTDLVEVPSVLKLLPNRFDAMVILDACCGSGKTTRYFAEHGAKLAVGIDISEKMIEKANSENTKENAVFICADVAKLNANANVHFDIVVSTAAFHFVEDLQGLFNSIYSVLNNGGIFCFSIEHPCMSANTDRSDLRWEFDKKRNAKCYKLKNYFEETYREHTWFNEEITVGIYHRTFSTIINSLIKAGFVIEETFEPKPDREILPETMYNLYNTRPSTLVIKCRKK